MIVVTGGAGFIGSNLVAALEAAGEDEIVVCDRLRDGTKWRNVSKRLIADLVPPEDILSYLAARRARISAVFHLGAISSTTATDGDLVMRTNVRGSIELWNACAAYRLPFIYASSAATYGDGARGFVDDNSLERLRALRPLNLYGWSKWLFDGWVLRAVVRGDRAPPVWAGMRFFNVYGPNEYHKGPMRSLVAKLVTGRRPGDPVTLFKSHREGIADGQQQRDFLHVNDATAIMLWLRTLKGSAGILNVGTGVARSFEDLALAAIRATGEDPAITYVDMPDTIREAYQYHTCADVTRLRALGYRARLIPLEEGVTEYVQNYLVKDDPYR